MARFESEGTWFSKEAQAERDRLTRVRPKAWHSFPHCDPAWQVLGDLIGMSPPPVLLIAPKRRRSRFGPLCSVQECPRLACIYGKAVFCADHQDQVNAGAVLFVAIDPAAEARVTYANGRVTATTPGGNVREVKPATKCTMGSPYSFALRSGMCSPAMWRRIDSAPKIYSWRPTLTACTP